jgi:hypothetical protein
MTEAERTMMQWFVLIAFTVGSLTAAEPLRFERRWMEAKVGSCGSHGCVSALFEYPELISGPAAVRARIDSAIREWLGSKHGDGPDLTPEEYLRQFAVENEQYVAESPPVRPGEMLGSLEKSIKLLRTTPPVLSLERTESSYFRPAAHPLFDTTYLNFDTRTGDTINLNSIFKEGALPRLNAIGLVYFRKARGLAPADDLLEAGFGLTDDAFELNENFGVTDRALTFYFNAYEIAPYAFGPTEVTIPLRKIKDLLRPGAL